MLMRDFKDHKPVIKITDMKKFILFSISWLFLSVTEAQTLKLPIYRPADESNVKMLKLNPRMELTLRIPLPEKDSVKEDITYKGLFHSGSNDSLVIKLDGYKSSKEFPGGIRQITTIPPDIYLKNTLTHGGLKSVALADIGYLRYQKGPKITGMADDVLEPVVFGSLLVLILSPLISYNYREGFLNANTYKNWALGSSLSLTSCIAILMAVNSINHSKNYQFRSGWPEEKAKVWQFRQNNPENK